MKETLYRTIVVGLLASILIVQIVTLCRTPKPLTLGDLYGEAVQKKSSEEQQALLSQVPVVSVHGSVEVETGLKSLDVTIERDKPSGLPRGLPR